MKSTHFAVLLLLTALLVLTTCHLFSGNQAPDINPLLGKWKIDSIGFKEDSTDFCFLLLGTSVDEGLPFDLQFDKDVLTYYTKGEAPTTVPYIYTDSTKQLIIKDRDMDIYMVDRLNDSTTGLKRKDSSIIFLKKR